MKNTKPSKSAFFTPKSNQVYFGDPWVVLDEEDLQYLQRVSNEKGQDFSQPTAFNFHSDIVGNKEVNLILADTAQDDEEYYEPNCFQPEKLTMAKEDIFVDSPYLSCIDFDSIPTEYQERAYSEGIILSLDDNKTPLEYRILEKSDCYEHQICQNGEVLVSIETAQLLDEDDD